MNTLYASPFRLTTTSAAAMVVAFTLLVSCGCATNATSISERDAPLSTYAEREHFRELLLAALDREALYTLLGGLKPMSTGFWQGKIDVAAPDTAQIAHVRRALAPLRSAAYYADVQAFATAHDGQRHVAAYIVHRAALAAMLQREAAFWSPLGIMPCTHPAEIVAIVDRLPRPDRGRAYGLLFGYPNYAIDFFVEATERARTGGGEVGPGKDREFYHIPTASATESQFTWAVPLGHLERDEDRALRARAEAILTAYRRAAPRIAAAHDPLREMQRLNDSLATTDDHANAHANQRALWQSAAHGRLAGVWSVEHVEVFAQDGSSSRAAEQASSLPEASVLHLNHSTLIVRTNLAGRPAGQSEIVRHRRQTRLPVASVSFIPAP